jgi:hypothetical protein
MFLGMEIELKLTPTEKAILNYFLAKGELKLTDMMLFYKTKISITEAVNRFILAGIASRGEGNNFQMNKEKVLKLLNGKK